MLSPVRGAAPASPAAVLGGGGGRRAAPARQSGSRTALRGARAAARRTVQQHRGAVRDLAVNDVPESRERGRVREAPNE